jgi:hypothetical protein
MFQAVKVIVGDTVPIYLHENGPFRSRSLKAILFPKNERLETEYIAILERSDDEICV